MPGLLLKFTDETGEAREVLVEAEVFEIGRHSENDLSLANSAVSRQHLKIEKFAHIYTVTDVGSTLGTTLNGEPLDEPKALKNGDRLTLGDALEIEIVLEDEEENKEETSSAASPNVSSGASSAASVSSASTGGGSSIPTGLFILAPLLVVTVLLGAGGLLLFLGGAKNTDGKDSEDNTEIVYKDNRRDDSDVDSPSNNSETNSKQTATPETTSTEENSIDDPPVNTGSGGTNTPLPPPVNSDDLSKIEVRSAQFLRKIADSDPKAFLLGSQQQIVKARIDQIKNSSALAANIKSAKANSARIAEIAASKNLKPQLLAVAAVARLGNSPGDAAQTAQSMAGVLDEMSRNIGTERADDALLTIAGYDQGAAGRSLDMRNMLQGLESKFPGNPRGIRTIWFLKEKNLISDAQFQAAVNFLAVGTIAQNPSEFGVSADALNF